MIADTENRKPNHTARQHWMAVLAKTGPEELEKAWRFCKDKPKYRFLRAPETGLIMVRGRAGGTGVRFNLGEVTVTRCAVQVEQGAIGTAYVMGRSRRQAELAALFDALLQNSGQYARLKSEIIDPLEAVQAQEQKQEARKVAATKVEFFTMLRGD
ncbi:MAG: phosphonate C-P lyase system protein PhnG [Desulfobacteraceae bacterium]|nr:MAG: phosphonate C-P lyase system protein PhnG [Desulfobacteraceae bacterium]